MIPILISVLILNLINTVFPEVTTFLPYGNDVGIGLSVPIIITVKPEACLDCAMKLELVPPYFTNSQTNQPMLDLKNSVVSYIGSNIVGANIFAGDTAETAAGITTTDGILSFDFGNVYIPAGSTDTDVIVTLDIEVKNIDSIQFNILTLHINDQLDNQYNFVKESLQVVTPDQPLIKTFEPENSDLFYESKDEPVVMFSVKLPVTSPTPVYNISITCSVSEASPNFLTATTNPNSVSIVVLERDGVELIHFLADELQPGHIIVGRFGVYLQNTLQPDNLNMLISVSSYSAPIHNNGRQLDVVQSDLLVPLRLKCPTIEIVDYPEASLVGDVINVTIAVHLPALLINYQVDIVAVFSQQTSAVEFLSISRSTEQETAGEETVSDNMVTIHGSAMLEEAGTVRYTMLGRVKASSQQHTRAILSAALSYGSDGGMADGGSIDQEIVLQHPLLLMETHSSEGRYVTLGSTVTYSVVVSHSESSAADAYSIVALVELSVPGILSSPDAGLSSTQLTGSKIQVTIPYLGVGEVFEFSIAATPTSDDLLQSKMKLIVAFLYSSCQQTNCQLYGTFTHLSSGLKIHSTDIGTEFSPSSVGIKHPFTLRIMPVGDIEICEYNTSISYSNGDVTFNLLAVNPPATSDTPINIDTSENRVRISMPDFHAVTSLEVSFSSQEEAPDSILTFGVRSLFRLCNSELVVDETINPSIEISDIAMDIAVVALTTTIQSETDFSYEISFDFTKNISVYDLTVTIHNTFIEFTATEGVAVGSDGVTITIPYLDSNTVAVVSGVARDVTLATDTSASWDYQYFSAPTTGKLYTGSSSLPGVAINQPSIGSFISNKVADKITIGEEFVFGIEILTSEMITDFVVRLYIPSCSDQLLFEVVESPTYSLGDDVTFSVAPTSQVASGTLEIWFQTTNAANSNADEGDLVTLRARLRSRFTMLQCQNTTFQLDHDVEYGLAPQFQTFTSTLYLTLAGPDLQTEFSQMPSLLSSYDAKDILLFDLSIRHTALSTAPAYNVTVELVCEELNVLGFSIITPPPLYLQEGSVSLAFGMLSVGETFAAVVRTELKQDVTVSRWIVCGGKVDYMSSDNEPSLNYIYTSMFLSKEIQLKKPTVALWDVGTSSGEYNYSIVITVPEGRLSSLIMTLNVGIGVAIVSCQIDHLALTSTSNSSVQVLNTAAQVELGSVYNRPDNMMTDSDLLTIDLVLRKSLPFGDLTTIYATLDTVDKSYAVMWNQECNLQMNLVRRDDKEQVEGGDVLEYDAVIAHDIMSAVDCVNGSIYLMLDNCEVRMGESLEIRSLLGIRKMVYIETDATTAVFKIAQITLGDTYTVPISVHVSDRIYPGSQVSLQSYIMYKSDTAGALQRKSETRQANIILSWVPYTTASLLTQHNSHVVSVGETLQIRCIITLPNGQMDLSVSAVGDNVDSVLMDGIINNMTSLTYDNVQETQGLNHAFVMFTQLYNPPNESNSVVQFTIPLRVYDSASNVDGRQLEVRLVIGYSLTAQSMIEDALFFTLQIVEPVLVVSASVTPSAHEHQIQLTLRYCHSAPPYLTQSSANAYNISTALTPHWNCESSGTNDSAGDNSLSIDLGVSTGVSTGDNAGDSAGNSTDVYVTNNTLHMAVLPLGQEAIVQLTCTPSSVVELGRSFEMVADTRYSSNANNGRITELLSSTGEMYASREPEFLLEISGLDGTDTVKMNEVVPISFSVLLPVGTFPDCRIYWRSSSHIELSVDSCQYLDQDIITRLTTNSLGQVSTLAGVVNEQANSTINCTGQLTTHGDPTDTGTVTVAVSYGIRTGVVARDISVTIPRLQVELEMEGTTTVQGNEMINAKYIVSHLPDSTGDAYNFWLNTTVVAASIGGSTQLNTNLEQVTKEDTRSFSFTLTVDMGLLPGTPVSFLTEFSYSTSPGSTVTYSLPSDTSPPLALAELLFSVTACSGNSEVPVGGFGYICVEITLPVCETMVDVSVRHPMGQDRELGEVVDGAEVTTSNPETTTFSQTSVRPLITRSEMSITDLANTGLLADTVSLTLPIHVFADELVFDADVIEFGVTIDETTFSGISTTTGSVFFTVTEPHLDVQLEITQPSTALFEQGDVVSVQYTIQHTPASLTPAFNVEVVSNSSMFSVAGDGHISTKLLPGGSTSGSLDLVLSTTPTLGEVVEVVVGVEYSSTATDVGRVYQDTLTVGQVRVASVSATLSASHARITVGQVFTISAQLRVPKARGSVSVVLGCQGNCDYISALQTEHPEESAVIDGNTLVLRDVTGSKNITLTLEAVMRDDVGERVEVYVRVDGVEVSTLAVYVAEIVLGVEEDGVVQVVDAHNTVSKPLLLLFNGTVSNITTSLTCPYTTTSNIVCQDTACLITCQISNTLPPNTNITCDLITGFYSHPRRGREYSSPSTIHMARSPPIHLSISGEPWEHVAVGTALDSYLLLNVSEVVGTMVVEVLCDGSDSFAITLVELLNYLTTVSVREVSRDSSPGCASLTLAFTPTFPSEALAYQTIQIRSSLVLRSSQSGNVSVGYRVTTDGGATELHQPVETCTPALEIASSLASGMVYVTSTEQIVYTSTVTNTGACSFHLVSISYNTSSSPLEEEDVGMELGPGEEQLFQYQIPHFPESLVVLQPSITVRVVTSLLPQYAVVIERVSALPPVFLISPSLSSSPARVELHPFSELLLTLHLHIPYLPEEETAFSVAVAATQGCLLTFQEISFIGSDLQVSEVADSPQSYTLSKLLQQDHVTNNSMISFSYTIKVTTPSPDYNISWTVTLGDVTASLEREVEVLTPDLGVVFNSGDLGGFIPGDVVRLTIRVMHNAGSRARAEEVSLLVTTPIICQNSTVTNTDLQVTKLNDTVLQVQLPALETGEELEVFVQSVIPATVEMEGRSFLYRILLQYRTPTVEAENWMEEESWVYNSTFETHLQIGEPGITLSLSSTPTPDTTITIHSSVLLRKGESDLLVSFSLSDGLVLQGVEVKEVGRFLSFSDSSLLGELEMSRLVVEGNNVTVLFGSVSCTNETTDRTANSFTIDLAVYTNVTVDYSQRVVGLVQFGRGEDTAQLSVDIAVPQLAVEMSCTVDNTTCIELIDINLHSTITYIVSLYHMPNSTGTAYNVILQLYVPLFDLNILSSTASTGVLENSGLGVKLTRDELNTSESITWETVFSVKDVGECSTAIVSLYDMSNRDDAAMQMLPILINFYTPKQEESFPYPEMYSQGLVGSPLHEYLYVCNTSCYAILENEDVFKLNSALHSVIGLTVTRTRYTVYGISSNGAYVMSTTLDNWISIPREIWTGVDDKTVPVTGPWPQQVETSGGKQFAGRTDGVYFGGDVIFSW